MQLKSGYSKDNTVEEYRAMTLDEAKLLQYGDHVSFMDKSGQARIMKINGAPKLWKRSPNRVEIPGKYGMYEFGTFTSQSDGTLQTLGGAMLLVKVSCTPS